MKKISCRSRSHDSPSYGRFKNSFRHPNSNMSNVYSPMSHFKPNMTHRYPNPSNSFGRSGRMLHNPAGIMGNRPPFSNPRGSMNNAAYLHNVQNMLQNMSNIMQQKQRGGQNGKFSNPNNPNNRFYQQFQNNYKKLKSGEKISNLYQASFPVHHIPREMRFNFRLLGRNIFTASDEEEEEKEKAKSLDKHSKKKEDRRRSSSDSSDSSEDDRRKRREDDESPAVTAGKSKISPTYKTSSKQKHSSSKTNRNRTTSTARPLSDPRELLNDSTNLTSLLAGIMQTDNPEMFANTLATAAAAVNKREQTKRTLEKTVQKFKDYARFQQSKTVGTTTTSTSNPDEAEKKIHGLARRLVSFFMIKRL